MTKVSIIIPVYNAAQYLQQSLDRVYAQTMQDFEVILVNDGSTDESGRILEDNARMHSNITVITQENQGPSAARNAALDVAKGEYCFFLDADDLMAADALEWLCKRADSQSADLVIAGFEVFNEFATFPTEKLDAILDLDEIDPFDPAILWTFSLWNKLYRRRLIEEHQIRFMPFSYSEDGIFVMSCVHTAKKITGLNHVVLYHRHLYVGMGDSITAEVTEKRLRDYVGAHQEIRTILARIQEQRQDVSSRKKKLYFGEFQRKYLQILLDQFYRQFWRTSPSLREEIVSEYNHAASLADTYALEMLQNGHLDVNVEKISEDPQEILASPVFAAIVYGHSGDEEQMLQTIQSLSLQTMVHMQIFVPTWLQSDLQTRGWIRENMFFLSEDEERPFYREALGQTTAPYVVFCTPGFVYVNREFRRMHAALLRSDAAFLLRLVYIRNGGTSRPLYTSEQIMDRRKLWQMPEEQDPEDAFDQNLGNKYFRREFAELLLKEAACSSQSLSQLAYRLGRYELLDDEGILYVGEEEAFFPKAGQEKPSLPDLKDPQFQTDRAMALRSMQDFPAKTFSDKIARKWFRTLGKLPVQNKVLFYSIRGDGELEGNAKALYPLIKGRKKICARRLPHDPAWERRMYYEMCTSKVIVTDDYDRYLRTIPLQEKQRVIQLWHACGAFKAFGRWGTNLSQETDAATHAQYNLVCVSGEDIRTIYASSFHVDRDKVLPLGAPRTDFFFDESYQCNIKNKLFDSHPEWRNRQILLYAPTFRDDGKDRSRFSPALCFAQLSEHLLPDQLLLIGPHPIMTQPILGQTYPNIVEVRDFSTNELMMISDLLITDYSSVIFEYALLGKPMAFFCYDLATYNREFYLRYPEDLPGPVLRNQEELESFLTTPNKWTQGRNHAQFISKYMTGCDGKSSRRIASVINAYLGTD